jgi:hypothetical protein
VGDEDVDDIVAAAAVSEALPVDNEETTEDDEDDIAFANGRILIGCPGEILRTVPLSWLHVVCDPFPHQKKSAPLEPRPPEHG